MSKNTTGRLDSIKTAFKSFLEAISRPENGDTVAERAYWEKKVPEIDWKAKSVLPTPGYSFDATNSSLALQEDLKTKSNYTNTYTTFCGTDAVTQINGNLIGEIQGVHYKVDGEMIGEMEIVTAQFDHHNIIPPDALGITVFVNEYGHASYQAFQLGKLKEYETGYDIDELNAQERSVYEFKLLVPHQTIPDAVTEMPNSVFTDMTKKVYERCKVRQFLPEKVEDELKSHLSNRMYYYYLYKNFC